MSEIDVSKCGFYHEECGKECHIALAFAENYTDADHTYFLCEQNPNCYYKQLQQAIAENEGLKSLNDFNMQKVETLEAENEELKKRFDKEPFLLGSINNERIKYKQCLDECLSWIEKEVNPYDTLLIIKNNIKEVLNYE